MRWGLTLRALCIAAAVTACGVNQALAQQADDQEEEDASTVENKASGWSVLFDPVISNEPAFDFLSGGMPDRLLYFTGLDIWRCGFGAYAGMQWAPKGINKDGFILRLFASESLERYTTTRRRYETQIFRGSVMPGVRFKRGNFEMQVLGGLDVEADYLLINRRFAALRSRIGARFATDVWWEPTRSLMLQYSLSGTMIDDGINTRVAAGWRLFDRFWIGPEASLSSDFFGQQYRIGAHLTGLRTGDYEWSIAAGHVQDSFQREGIYGRLGITVRPPREPFFEN